MTQDPQFWILISFLIVIGFSARRIYKIVTRQLDTRSALLSRQLREITDLHHEAELLFFKERTRVKKTKKQAHLILDQAKIDFKKLQKETQLKVIDYEAAHIDHLEQRFKIMKQELEKEIKHEVNKNIGFLVEGFLKQELTPQVQEDLIKEFLEYVKLPEGNT